MGPYSIATDGKDVFWGNSLPASVMKVGICGGMVQTLAKITDTVPVTVLVALDTNNVYWMASDNETPPTISKCAKSGCGGAPATLITGAAQQSINAIAVDNTNVYWTSAPGFPSSLYSIMKMPSGGGAQTVLATSTTAYSIAVDATSIYWLGTTGLYKCSLSGCGSNSVSLSTVQGNGLMAVDSTNVYTADYGPGSVYACSKNGCGANPTKLANGTNIQGITSDGAHVYWTDGNGSSTGWIMKCAIGGCGMNPTILKTISDTPRDIAVDATSVYWTTVSGVVMRSNK